MDISADELTLDDLQNGYYIYQLKDSFRFGVDAVLLSDFADIKPGANVIDLGTGTGIIPILLAAKTKGKHFTGIDIQEMRSVRAEEIAARYFGPSEEHYVALWGDDGFYDLWVRKEAAVKYAGQTLAGGIGTEVAEDGDLLTEIVIDGKTVILESIDMGPYVKCACAAEKKEDICIRMLMG